jgi:hypothetical protein
MKEYLKFLKSNYLKLIPHLVLLLSIVMSYFSVSDTINLVVKATMTLSFALAIYFTVNVNLSFHRHLNNVVVSQNNIIETYKINISTEYNIKQMINNFDSKEVPYLAMDLVKYEVVTDLLAPFRNEDKIKFIDTVSEVWGRTYYAIINNKKIELSFDKPKEIENYIKNAEWMKIQNGHAFVEKTKHLLVYKLINFGKDPILALHPVFTSHNLTPSYSKVTPLLLKPNEEVLVFVLVETKPRYDREFKLDFQFTFKEKCYYQRAQMNLENGDLRMQLIYSEPKECPPQDN